MSCSLRSVAPVRTGSASYPAGGQDYWTIYSAHMAITDAMQRSMALVRLTCFGQTVGLGTYKAVKGLTGRLLLIQRRRNMSIMVGVRHWDDTHNGGLYDFKVKDTFWHVARNGNGQPLIVGKKSRTPLVVAYGWREDDGKYFAGFGEHVQNPGREVVRLYVHADFGKSHNSEAGAISAGQRGARGWIHARIRELRDRAVLLTLRRLLDEVIGRAG
jgi:hypothetical protein